MSTTTTTSIFDTDSDLRCLFDALPSNDTLMSLEGQPHLVVGLDNGWVYSIYEADSTQDNEYFCFGRVEGMATELGSFSTKDIHTMGSVLFVEKVCWNMEASE